MKDPKSRKEKNMRKSKKDLRVLISAGGTGGHLIPAQQLAFSLIEKGCSKIVFAAKDISNRSFFQKNNFIYKDIASALPSKNILKFIFSILKGFLQSLLLILKLKPNVVIGFGSYHTFPVILAAFFLRKKIVLFEANTKLGRVNRFFSKAAFAIASQFPLRDNLKKKEIIIKHLPWHRVSKVKDESLYEKIGLEKSTFTFFIYGGSQGSKYINEVFCESIKSIHKNKKMQVIHFIGKDQNEKMIKSFYDKLNIKSYVKEYEPEIHKYLPLADLIISRSGASTIAEILTFEIPAILVPFPNAMEAHQDDNAAFMKEIVKGVVVINQKELNSDLLSKEIKNLIGKDLLSKMLNNIKSFNVLDNNENKKNLSDLVFQIGLYEK